MKTTPYDKQLAAKQTLLSSLSLALANETKEYNKLSRQAILELLDISYDEIIHVKYGELTLAWRVASEVETKYLSDSPTITIYLVKPVDFMLGVRTFTLEGARVEKYTIYKNTFKP